MTIMYLILKFCHHHAKKEIEQVLEKEYINKNVQHTYI